jgi:hypothetical protein
MLRIKFDPASEVPPTVQRFTIPEDGFQPL